MDRFKKHSLAAGGLIALFSFFSLAQELPPKAAGTVTQAEGEITYLAYAAGSKVKEVKANAGLMTSGSYLTHEDSFLTAKLFEGSFLRASPKTKFTVELDEANKAAVIHLYTGSLKVLFSHFLNGGKLQKIIVKCLDNAFESSEGKFSVVRSIDSSVNVYVEKGLVTAARPESDVFQYVHANETLSINDRTGGMGLPKQMNDKERKFMHGNFYLKIDRRKI